ncbi:MAG: FMN-binding glutamate synthase family protein [Cyclobacteriaceae bacterium]|nr:MAG: FMN-binding glutamate synthase family protein [Cyclobacteriaceae bacterium]
MTEILDFLTQWPWWVYLLVVLFAIFIRDIFNKEHTIKHNFPIVGHLRYLLESIGPELRQYIVANNREELPFNRRQRSWIYASAKSENNYQGFGTDQDQNEPGFVFVNPTMIPYSIPENHPNRTDNNFCPCAKIIGEGRRKKPFRPASIVNISAMSFGSLSARAVSALNLGAIKANCYHNTGEGGLSPYHSHGADVVFHFGTGYFGARDDQGNFSMPKLVELVEQNPFIKAIEVKLSQGAKPGKGGVLPGKKITAEIAAIRNVPKGQDVLSPTNHTAFSNISQLVDFIEDIADKTGLPVGIKSAVGRLELWRELVQIIKTTNRGPDFITIDGGEGGTGAAPPSFSDHVSLPFTYAFAKVYKLFLSEGLSSRIVFCASGKLGLPAHALKAFAMGADMINVARESMMAIGCIQAQRCHTNMCPTGVATQNKWLESGINVPIKSERFYNYVKTLRKEVLEITHSAGYEHPCQMTTRDVDISMGDNNHTKMLQEAYGYQKAPVQFDSMQALADCKYLGGAYKKQQESAATA